ncbi:MAG: hypothetical protein H3C71_01630 [Flavobacteriales bacterium]|nr:hypothetical protein [Flavobacteriales bacterium]
MKKTCITIFSVLTLALQYTAQNVGINATGSAPNTAAGLDVDYTDKGMLIPRVSIANINSIAPITGGSPTSLLVYNTNGTTGLGYHYWDGSKWVRIFDSNNGKFWSLAGNAGTVPGTDYIGTSDAQHLVFKTTNVERVRILSGGNVLVNHNTAVLSSAALESAMGGSFSVGIYGVGNGGTASIFAENQSGNADALYAFNTAANGTGNGTAIWATSNQTGWPAVAVGLRSTSAYSNTAISSHATIGSALIAESTVPTATTTAIYNTNQTTTNIGFALDARSNQTGGATIMANLRGASYFGNAAISASSNVAGNVNSYGVIAQSVSTGAQSAAVKGQTSTSPSGGVFLNSWVNTSAVGLTGQYTGGGAVDAKGVVGIATSSVGWGYGVLGQGNWYGVYANGNLGASGGKFFHIDYPLDPENKFLRHMSIESNEILNMYRGVAVVGNDGKAMVSLPEYFDAVNINASYQLTAVGASMPNLHISKEIENREFEIAGGEPGKKVNWVVYAQRNDPYVQQNPHIKDVIVEKKDHEKGKYLMPELYGQPKEKGIFYDLSNKTMEELHEQPAFESIDMGKTKPGLGNERQ